MIVKTETNQLIKVEFLNSDQGMTLFFSHATKDTNTLKDSIGATLLKDLQDEANALGVCFLTRETNLAITKQTLNKLIAYKRASIKYGICLSMKNCSKKRISNKLINDLLFGNTAK